MPAFSATKTAAKRVFRVSPAFLLVAHDRLAVKNVKPEDFNLIASRVSVGAVSLASLAIMATARDVARALLAFLLLAESSSGVSHA